MRTGFHFYILGPPRPPARQRRRRTPLLDVDVSVAPTVALDIIYGPRGRIMLNFILLAGKSYALVEDRADRRPLLRRGQPPIVTDNLGIPPAKLLGLTRGHSLCLIGCGSAIS